MPHSISAPLFSIFLLLFSMHVSAKDVRYVSDDLTIPMRTGTTINHKILKFLNSGMPVEVVEEAEDGQYVRVVLSDDDKTGWVKAELLMNQPSARDQLAQLKKKYQATLDKQDELKQQIVALKKKENELAVVKNTLQQLQESAAEPIRIAEENIQLKRQLAEERVRNDTLEKENAFLADDSIKQWFVIGGAVSIGSLLLGLLITRINWRKKDSWAGTF